MSNNQKGFITNIQHFSIHDGPGVRTVIFFKGCNLRCKWCHNPETYIMSPQVLFYEEKCIRCGSCDKICPNHNFDLEEHINSNCKKCVESADSCYFQARVQIGQEVTVEYIMEQIKSNIPYFKDSNSGVSVCCNQILHCQF